MQNDFLNFVLFYYFVLCHSIYDIATFMGVKPNLNVVVDFVKSMLDLFICVLSWSYYYGNPLVN